MSSILPKKRTWKCWFYPSLLGPKFFVCFLGKLKKPKSPFEINWPLEGSADFQALQVSILHWLLKDLYWCKSLFWWFLLLKKRCQNVSCSLSNHLVNFFCPISNMLVKFQISFDQVYICLLMKSKYCHDINPKRED